MTSIAQLHDAVVTSKGYPLLSGVTVDIEQGSVVVLSGPNGAGKTSLLRLLAGLEPLAKGSGRVLDVDLVDGDRRQLRRQVGWLGHEGSFYDDLSVIDNLHFAARAFRRPLDQVPTVLSSVGLGERSNTLARQLSAGQRRRLGLAWLLLRRPPLWLLDEPYASLDEAGRQLLSAIINDASQQGVSVVLSAHDPLRHVNFPIRHVAIRGGRCDESRAS